MLGLHEHQQAAQEEADAPLSPLGYPQHGWLIDGETPNRRVSLK